jgi:hypothetical protein
MSRRAVVLLVLLPLAGAQANLLQLPTGGVITPPTCSGAQTGTGKLTLTGGLHC